MNTKARVIEHVVESDTEIIVVSCMIEMHLCTVSLRFALDDVTESRCSCFQCQLVSLTQRELHGQLQCSLPQLQTLAGGHVSTILIPPKLELFRKV